jgi:DNA polymerase/3'-5' exonuclease PolX
MNSNIVSKWKKLIEQTEYEIDNAKSKSDANKNQFRLRQFKNALKVLETWPSKIKSIVEFEELKGFGKGILKRLEELIKTKTLKELKDVKKYGDYAKYIDDLSEVIGIGRKHAHNLVVNHGIKSVKELKRAHKESKIELNDKILLGLKWYKKYKQNIPREEVHDIYNYLNKQVKKINPELVVVICGSYRRMKVTSNDIDVLLTIPTVKTKDDFDKQKKNCLQVLVSALKKKKFLVDDMTDKHYETKYMGFCQLTKKHNVRRIDIRYMPYNSYYSALLYFTGSGDFNKKMRMIAISNGYLLNEYGLYRVYKRKDGTKVKKMIRIRSEKNIFDILGMKYVDPQYR